MSLKYKIIANLSESGTIAFNSETLKRLGLDSKRLIYVRFGIKAFETKVKSSDGLSTNEILLSNDIIKDLIIPLFGSYEILLKGNEIIIGPYIGMLTAKSEDELKKSVNYLTSYVYSYDEIGGAILFFTSDGVDMKSQLIHGFVFDPKSKKWIEGTYSYPAAIFKRIWVKKELTNHFRSLLGDRIFNNYYFDKWETYDWLSRFDAVKEYLPVTRLYKTPYELKMFLDEHDSIYIKPISGSEGKGVMKLEKKNDLYFLYYTENYQKQEKCFRAYDDLNLFLNSNIKENRYVLQKSLKLINIEESMIDFRLMLLKDQNGEWQDIGMIARVGIKGSIVSNLSAGASLANAEATLKDVLKLSEVEVIRLRKKMTDISLAAAEALENCGIHCGNLGFDITMDTNDHIWILEINNLNPNHIIAKTAGEKKMFYRARLLNMLYAKGLSGFKNS